MCVLEWMMTHKDCVRFCVCPCLLQEDDMPDEVNIDDLLDLSNDEERVKKLKVTRPV